VCGSLDEDAPLREDDTRCCVESICDPSPSLACLDGWLTSGTMFPSAQ
jgi:hypothetical protein